MSICGVKGSPFPKQQILNSTKLKQSADDNFKFHANSMKFSKWIENTVGKGEIARYSVFKRLVSKGRQKVSLCGNGLSFSQMTNSRLFQTERVCNLQF